MLVASDYWVEVKDGDPRAVGIFRRHYSCESRKHDHVRYGFSGNGQSLVLLLVTSLALFCWRRVIGEGVVCSVFRNESAAQSSTLILAAEEMAWQKWSRERLYTYVNSKRIRSSHPGYCFIKAGWDYVRDDKGNPILTKAGLHILEKYQV